MLGAFNGFGTNRLGDRDDMKNMVYVQDSYKDKRHDAVIVAMCSSNRRVDSLKVYLNIRNSVEKGQKQELHPDVSAEKRFTAISQLMLIKPL